MLVPKYVDGERLFSTLCSSFFLVGYSRMFNKQLARFRAQSTSHQVIIVGAPILVAWSLLVVLSGVGSLGDVNQSWAATSLRGEGLDELAETIRPYASDQELLAQHQAATLQRRERAGLDRYEAALV